MDDAPFLEHELWHRLDEIEGELRITHDLAATEKAEPGAPSRYEKDVARLRSERAKILGRLGDSARAHRIEAHNDHQRRLRAAVEAYNAAVRRASDALREAQALAAIAILLPGDGERPGDEKAIEPPCDLAALSRIAPGTPISLGV